MQHAAEVGGSQGYWRLRSVVDIAGALLLLPTVACLALILMVLNPMFNPGPLLYRQRRMGKGCTPFLAIKFRTMTCGVQERGANDPVEVDRITPLGGILRRMGLDELPQAINVLRREMSLIGPRPDCVHHAEEFLAAIPEYRRRFAIRPGMSGLSQIKLGYAVGLEATRAKALTDIDYIDRAGLALDLWIAWRTLVTVATGRGD
ncbi:sugar transferase [Rhodobacteraceae bacterium N5(2021)]|uniref:Sugar transferase n=2 Tax=Gymnodinialimonas phycosphaerae TaxID=2841589 RepID=A0A975TYW4_9RHOB|nr:sugar transferase [Gymnodinialimonas phycosphaerae]